MRRLALALALLALLLGIGYAVRSMLAPDQQPDLAPSGDVAARPTAPEDAAIPPAAATGSRATEPPRETVPAPPVPRAPDLADEVTAVLQILDASTGAPVPAAAVYRFAATAEAAIAYSDAKGFAPLPLRQGGQFIVARAGYLLRLAPTQLGSTMDVPQIVSMQPDRYCTRCAFHFRTAAGNVPTEVFVRFRPQRPGDKDPPMPAAIRDGDDVLKRAWYEQRTLAVVRAVPEVHVQLGLANATFVHALAGDDEVAFVEPGLFELDAATANGLVARALFDTAEVSKRPLSVLLRRGGEIRGVVRDTDGAPIEGAIVAIVGSDPLRLGARSAADGSFAIGPLADGSFGLEVRHRDHATAHAGPLSPGPERTEVTMAALPKGSVRGRVLAAGTHTPVADVRATLLVANGDPIVASTDADGWFAVPFAGTDSMRLSIAGDAYLPHSELVDPGTNGIEIELWPRTAARRLELGLSGVIRGIVVDTAGQGIAGYGIRYQADDAAVLPPAGRRVLTSGRQALSPIVQTNNDGTFQLETPTAGAGTLTVLQVPSTPPVRVQVNLGRAVEGVRIVTERRQ